MLVRASFPPEPRSAPAARRVVERTLVEWGLPDLIETTRLLVSEVVTNAVLHAGTDAQLVLRTGSDRLRVEVSDRSQEVPRVQDGPPSAPTGRGLLIVDRLADDWGVDVDPGGKTVWFELELVRLAVASEGGRSAADPDAG